MARDSLFFHRDFRRLWVSDTTSQFGTFVGQTVLPILAATTLAATPFEMGLLTAVVWGAIPLGGLTGGLLGEWLGLRGTIWAACALMSVAALWVACSPLRHLRDIPMHQEAAPAHQDSSS